MHWHRAGDHESPQPGPSIITKPAEEWPNFGSWCDPSSIQQWNPALGPQKGSSLPPLALSYVTQSRKKCAERFQCSVPDRTCLSVAGTFLQNELGLVMLIGHGPRQVESQQPSRCIMQLRTGQSIEMQAAFFCIQSMARAGTLTGPGHIRSKSLNGSFAATSK
jgi:hypothetical protein